MITVDHVRGICAAAQCDFAILAHERPIRTVRDAEGIFDLAKAAPVYVLEHGAGLLAVILSASRGRPDVPALTQALGLAALRMAAPAALRAAGMEPGSVPLVGHGLSCVFDGRLLEHEYIYGGAGHPLHTLRIAPGDVARVNTVVLTLS